MSVSALFFLFSDEEHGPTGGSLQFVPTCRIIRLRYGSAGRTALLDQGETMLHAREIMSTSVITAKPSMTVEELARILVENRISGVPVLGDDGSLFGIVTENDLISQNKRLHIPTVLRLFDAYVMLGSPGAMEKEFRKMAGVTVGEICTRDVITISEDATIEEIATIMSEQKVHLLPVVSAGKVVGVVGKADLIRAMLK